MINSKYLVISSGAGFILSFVTGLFFSAALPVLLLRALISAVVFAAIAAGIQLLAQKFFISPQNPEGRADLDETGSMVDITLDGEDLQRESDVSFFDIGNIDSSLGRGYPGGAASPVESADSEPVAENFQGFQPLSFGTGVEAGDFSQDDDAAPKTPERDSVFERKPGNALKKENLDALTVAQTIRTMLAGEKNT
jgi:hypothetical protein